MGIESEMVCVTGAAGFIGSWLVMRLLERGYTVRATVRDPGPILFFHLIDFEFSFFVLFLRKQTLLILWVRRGREYEEGEALAGAAKGEDALDTVEG